MEHLLTGSGVPIINNCATPALPFGYGSSCGNENGYLGDLITTGSLHNSISDGTRDAVKAIGDASRDGIRETSRAESAVVAQLSEARLATAISGSETRAAVKDALIAVLQESCNTREKIFDKFSVLNLQASENKAALSAQIAECCCENRLAIAELKASIAADAALVTANRLRDLELINTLKGVKI